MSYHYHDHCFCVVPQKFLPHSQSSYDHLDGNMKPTNQISANWINENQSGQIQDKKLLTTTNKKVHQIGLLQSKFAAIQMFFFTIVRIIDVNLPVQHFIFDKSLKTSDQKYICQHCQMSRQQERNGKKKSCFYLTASVVGVNMNSAVWERVGSTDIVCALRHGKWKNCPKKNAASIPNHSSCPPPPPLIIVWSSHLYWNSHFPFF